MKSPFPVLMARLPMLILALVIASFANRAEPQTFETQQWQQGYSIIDSQWRFHPGDDPAWASPTFDDSQWQLVEAGKLWKRGISGYGWFRLRMKLPETKEPLAIDIGHMNSAAEVYINGTLVGTSGVMRPKPDWSGGLQVNMSPIPVELNGQWIEIAVRDWKSPVASSYSGGGFTRHPIVGTLKSISEARKLDVDGELVQESPDLLVGLLYAVLGVFSLGLFLMRRQASEYAWFAASALAGAYVVFAYGWLWGAGSVTFLEGDTRLVNAFAQIAQLLFIWKFIHAKADRLLFCASVLALAQGIVGCAAFYQLLSLPLGESVATICGAIVAVLILVRLVRSTMRGNLEARLLLPAEALLGSLVVIDGIKLALSWAGRGLRGSPTTTILFQNDTVTVHTSDPVQLLFLITIAAALVLRFTRSAERDERLSSEVAAAQEVQMFLVPRSAPQLDGFKVDAEYLPASEVGGDFYHVLQLPDGSARIVVGDVSGKGLKAAMTVSAIMGALRVSDLHSPAEVLGYLNRVLYGQVSGFVTCCAILVASDGSATLSNAGNPAPYWNGREMPVEPGLPLGMVAEIDYTETQCEIAPGDQLTFVSDGVVEATNPQGELFGFDRTQAVSNQPANAIVEVARQFGQQDDITVVTLTREIVETPAGTRVSVPPLSVNI